ncbi:hypothetical protein MTP03_18070 [Tsukamurella sp. PLM1]|nr:hypothetical protein MTP03_18070 [Tsukamurella sp. PLM1]
MVDGVEVEPAQLADADPGGVQQFRDREVAHRHRIAFRRAGGGVAQRALGIVGREDRRQRAARPRGLEADTRVGVQVTRRAAQAV